MIIEFSSEIIFWRGPAPYYYIAVPDEQSADIKTISRYVTYGWGVIPVRVRIGSTEWETSLFPKDGRYLIPIRVSVRKAENLDLGDEVSVWLKVGRTTTSSAE